MRTVRVRSLATAGFLVLLVIAVVRVPQLPGQGAVPSSKSFAMRCFCRAAKKTPQELTDCGLAVRTQ